MFLLLTAGAVMLVRGERPMIMPMMSGAMLYFAMGSGGWAAFRN